MPAAAEEGGEGKDEKTHWYIFTAQAMGKLNTKLQAAILESQSIISYYNEWCETPFDFQPGFAYQDLIYRFRDDRSEAPYIESMEHRSPADRIYMGNPIHVLGQTDPVLNSAVDRYMKFIRTTYWGQFDGFEIQQAAIALAKRKENVDQMVFTLGAGGCGMSQHTKSIAASLGDDVHMQVDGFVLYQDEELRKIIPDLDGKAVFTFEEAVHGTHQDLRLDIYKRWCSGGKLPGRLPYGKTTRMYQIIGFKRFECKDDRFQTRHARNAVQ